MTKYVLPALIAAAVTLTGADKKHKGPDVEILEATATRGEKLISIDSKLRNVAGKPIRGLTLVFDFFGPGHAPITTQKTAVEEESLAANEESMVRAQLNDPVKAVTFEISAVDEQGHDLKVAKPGPYPID